MLRFSEHSNPVVSFIVLKSPPHLKRVEAASASVEDCICKEEVAKKNLKPKSFLPELKRIHNLGNILFVADLEIMEEVSVVQHLERPAIHLPTVKDVHEVDCLQMAMQSRVTADSGWARRPLEEQLSPSSHMTVVPEVFS